MLWYKRIQEMVSIWLDVFGGCNQNINIKRRAILSFRKLFSFSWIHYLFSTCSVVFYPIFLNWLMTKKQHDYLSRIKENEVQLTSLRSFILVRSELEYTLCLILVYDVTDLCFIDFPRVCEDPLGTPEFLERLF